MLGLVVLGKGGVDISEYFCVHYIGRRNERWLAIDRRVCDHNSDVFGVPHPGESDVELAVGEDRRGQVEGNFLKGLALGLVDGHGEGGADRKLSATDEMVINPHDARRSKDKVIVQRLPELVVKKRGVNRRVARHLMKPTRAAGYETASRVACRRRGRNGWVPMSLSHCWVTWSRLLLLLLRQVEH